MNSSLYLSPWGRSLVKSLMKTRGKLKPEQPAAHHNWKIVRGDKVQVINGPQTGQRGTVKIVIRKQNRVIIDGVNLRRRVVKPLPDGTPGRLITRPTSLHYSNVLLIDPTTDKPTKAAYRYTEEGKKVRVSKSSGHIIAKPEPLADRKPRSVVVGPKDTASTDVFEVTFSDYEKYAELIYQGFKKSI